AAKDTPALAEQFHQLDDIITSVLDQRETNPADFVVAVLATGGNLAPHFTTDDTKAREDALFILSNLPLSYSKAGATLKGADEAAIAEFAAEQYQGWKIGGVERQALVGGTLEPEAALRASYEPALKIGYQAVQPEATVYGLGLNAAAGLDTALRAIVGAKPGPATPVAE
ncbi:MAG TPA: hypothetical protein VF719_03325, partial [Abditibacteriaceae bacterium]